VTEFADLPEASRSEPAPSIQDDPPSPPVDIRAIDRADCGAQRPFTAWAADDYPIKGFFWRHPQTSQRRRPVVIINPATSVRCRYYFRFADFLFERGFDVIAYDYRGIGESRPAKLRGFDAGWIDWGRVDFEAVLKHADASFSSQPIDIVAHSIGGFVIGLAPSNHRIRRIFTVGAQYAYRHDYADGKRPRMLAKWHIFMPLLTMLFGYFPGQRLGWLEDTPKGVVRDWAFSRERFEDTWRGRSWTRHLDKRALVQQFAAVTAPILALSMTDDEFGTVPAIERLLAYFSRSRRTHLRISPQSIGEPSIGHFAFFNKRFERKLWPIALQWLDSASVAANAPGVTISEASATPQKAPQSR
jgi:predicted alpha/beta hydrolase